jgi:hypothetical protein
MSPETKCPSCGASLEDNVGSACPFCGSALSAASAPTLLSVPASRPSAQTSAEAMDEIKNLIREGDPAGATLVAGAEFGLNPEAAQTVVEQAATDMKYSGAPEPVSVEPETPAARAAEPVIIENRPVETPKKPSSTQPWIIGGSIVAVIFLCCCCCLPLALMLVSMARSTH